jgi:hypothetical protein
LHGQPDRRDKSVFFGRHSAHQSHQSLARSSGFRIERFDSHGYVQTSAPDYMLTLVDRGADVLANSKRVDPSLADALKREARRRVENGEFFGFIAFASLIGRKPA